MSSQLYVSMYHYTRDLEHSRYPGIKGLDYPLFEWQLQFFAKNFNVVTMQEVLESLDGVGLPENALLLTFDDGYIDNFTVALPLLKKYGMQGSFFIPGKTFTENKVLDVNKIHFILASVSFEELKKDVLVLLDKYRDEGNYPSNEALYEEYAKPFGYDDPDTIFVKRMLQTAIPENVRTKMTSELFDKYVGISEEMFARELYMNRDQIRYMRDAGMFIGIHGYDHYWLGNMTEERMRRDVDKALDIMDEFIDRDSWVISYPYSNGGGGSFGLCSFKRLQDGNDYRVSGR